MRTHEELNTLRRSTPLTTWVYEKQDLHKICGDNVIRKSLEGHYFRNHDKRSEVAGLNTANEV